MAAPLVLFWLVSLLMGGGECRPSLLNPNSVARPSVTYGRDHSPLEKDIAAIFNKVAHGSTAAPPNATTHIPTTTSPPPTTPPPPTTTTPNPATPLTPQPDTPEFVSRPRFKPPLPPEYTNPFADKAILRGSQSEGPAAANNRRQLPAPPPPPIRPPPEVERIPIRPPDLTPIDRKKPLNTPAGGGNGASSSIHRPENESNNKNETAEENIPLLQSPSVTRILSENANNRPDDNERRNNNSNSRVLLDLVNKDSMIDVQAPATLPSNIPSQDTPHVVTDPPRSYPVPEWPSHIGGMTWDVIVYTLASLFVLLALYAFIICPFRATDSLITKGSYIFLHIFLFIIGTARGGYLFYDAYNIRGSLPQIADRILLDMVFPCIFSAFAIMFYALAKITKVQLCNSRAQSPAVLSLAIIINIIVFFCFEYAADTLDLISFLISALRALPLLSILSVIMGFLIAFRCLYRAARRLQGDVLRANFAKMGALPRRPQLKLASRIILSAALLILVLCGVQLYILFGFYSDQPPRPWPWWGCQLAARILELCVCFLLAGVAWLRRTGVPAKFGSCCCVTPTDNKSVEDMFPAICSKNNAIHNYSLHTGKTVYENNTLKSTSSPYVPPPPISVNTMPLGSLKRSSLGKCGTMPSNREATSKRQQQQQQQQHYYNNKSVKSSSMLFAEDGVVRFRTTNDPEQPMQEVLHRSLTRHEALTAFNVSDESQIGRRNRSGSLGDLRETDQYTRSIGRTRVHRQRMYQRSLDPPDSPEQSSLSGCSSSDLSECDLTSGGYERVRTQQQQQQQTQHREHSNPRKNHHHQPSSNHHPRSLRYKPSS